MLEDYREAWTVMSRDPLAWVLTGALGYVLWLPSFGLVFISMQQEIAAALSAGRAPRPGLLFDEQRLVPIAKPAAKLFAAGLLYAVACILLVTPALIAAGALLGTLPFLSACIYLFALLLSFGLLLIFLLAAHWTPMLVAAELETGWGAFRSSYSKVAGAPRDSFLEVAGGMLLLASSSFLCGLPLLVAWPLFWIQRWIGFERVRGGFSPSSLSPGP